jgi:murein L,D-transpeptidase YcbB/YkuD
LLLVWPALAAAGLRLEVNLPAYSLRLYDGDDLVMARPVTIGAPEHPTPVGRWQVRRLIWNPRWMPPPSMDTGRARPMPPGPGNPMGAVKLPLTGAIYLHGTERRGEIGRPASHGCIRLANADARALARALQRRQLDAAARERIRQRRQGRPDTPVRVTLPEPVPVRVRYEPLVLEGEDRGVLHPDVYGRVADARAYLRRALAGALGVPEATVSLGAGGLVAQLGERWDRPLRFALEID